MKGSALGKLLVTIHEASRNVEVRAFNIFAGSEEIMMDLGVRQAMKEWDAVQSRM